MRTIARVILILSGLIIGAATGLSVAAESQAQDATRAAAPGIGGTWTSTVETPHGALAMSFVLHVDARDPKKVTGTFTGEHMGEKLPLEGAYADGRLEFTVGEGAGLRIVARLDAKNADVLNGALSTERGDLAFVAKRAK
jgi:hypothetical protein